MISQTTRALIITGIILMILGVSFVTLLSFFDAKNNNETITENVVRHINIIKGEDGAKENEVAENLDNNQQQVETPVTEITNTVVVEKEETTQITNNTDKTTEVNKKTTIINTPGKTTTTTNKQELSSFSTISIFKDVNTKNASSGTVLAYNGNQWVPAPAGKNTDNQLLSVNKNNLTIENGNTVALPMYIAGKGLKLKNDEEFIVDAPECAATQVLTWDGSNFQCISSNSTIDFISLNDTPASYSANQLVRVNSAGNALEFYDDSVYYDNTDDQNLTSATLNTSTNVLTIAIEDGNPVSVDLTNLINDADFNPTNEIQDLNLNGNNLTITNNTGATTIDLSPYLDNTDNQQIDTFTLSADVLTLEMENDGQLPQTVNLSAYMDNTDNQQIALSSDIITLSNGTGANTTVDLTPYINTDSQAISLNTTTNILSITGNTSTADLSLYLDNTDNQTLSISDHTISLTNGGSVVVPDNDTTYSAGGTLLNLSGTTFSLNEGTLTNNRLCTCVLGSGLVCNTADNSTNWNTAYSWGNHALAGYLTDAPSDGNTYGRQNGSWTSLTLGSTTFLGLLDTSMTTYTEGSVLFTSPTAVTENNSNFFWDNDNNRLGVGLNNPVTALDVNGGIKFGNESSVCIPALAGTTRYNATSQVLELCDGTSWQELGSSSGSGGFGETIPAGTVMAYTTDTCPTNWIATEGQEISRAGYPDLYAILGDTYGNGDGSTTFNIPDYRGRFLRGWDNGAGVDPDAATRTDRGDGTTGDVVGSKQDDMYASHSHAFGSNVVTFQPGSSSSFVNDGTPNTDVGVDSATSSAGSNETRPKNINVLYCIKTTNNAGGTYLSALWDTDVDTGIQTEKNPDEDIIRFDIAGTELMQLTAIGLTINSNTVWHGGNDGTGSGLDADLLDGNDSSYFMAATTDNWVNTTGDTMTGTLNAQSILPTADDTYDLGSSTARWQDLFLGPNSLHIGTDGDEGVISYSTVDNAFNFDQKIKTASSIQIGGDADACDATKEGAMRYNDITKVMEFCDGTSWGVMGSGSALPTCTDGQMLKYDDSTNSWICVDVSAGGICQIFTDPVINISGTDYPMGANSVNQMNYCQERGYDFGEMITSGVVIPTGSGTCAEQTANGGWVTSDGCTTTKAVQCCYAGGGSGGGWVHSGQQVFNGNLPTTWTDLDLSSVIGNQRALVVLRFDDVDPTNVNANIRLRQTSLSKPINGGIGHGTSGDTDEHSTYITMETDVSGVLQFISDVNNLATCTVVGYIGSNSGTSGGGKHGNLCMCRIKNRLEQMVVRQSQELKREI